DPTRTPDGVAAAERPREQSDTHRAADMGRSRRVDQRPDRVARRDVREGGFPTAGAQTGAPGGGGAEQAPGEPGRCDEEPAGPGVFKRRKRLIDAPSAEVGRAEHEETGRENRKAEQGRSPGSNVRHRCKLSAGNENHVKGNL